MRYKMLPYGVKWEFSLSEDSLCLKTEWATVWFNGVWHTWDKDGTGGENGKERTMEEAIVEATHSAYKQGFIEKVR